MSSVDNRIVEMQFKNEQFESGVKTSVKSLETLTKSLELKDAGKSFESLQKASQNVSFAALANSVDAISRRFTTLGIMGVTALQNITNSAINAGKEFIKSVSIDQVTSGFSKYEQKIRAVQTIMNATGKSVNEVNEYLDRLMWFSDETSYGFNDMTDAIAGMTSSGGDIDKLIPLVTGLASAVAYAGKGAAEYKMAMYNVKQSYGRGFMQGEDWKSLENAGVASEALKQMMIDEGVAQKTLKKGEVTIGTFQDSLTKKKWATTTVMEKTLGEFSKLSEAVYTAVKNGQYKTAALAIEGLKGGYSEMAVKAFKAAQTAKTFTEAIYATKDAVGTGWMKTFELVFGNIEEASALWSGVTADLLGVFGGGMEDRNAMFAEWKNLGGRTELIKVYVNLLNTFKMISGEIGKVFKEIFPAMTAEKLMGITQGFQKFTASIVSWLTGINGGELRITQIGKIFKGIFAIFDIGWKVISAVGKAIWGVFKPLLGTGIDGLLTFFANIGDSISKFAAGLETNTTFLAIFQTIGNTLSWFVAQAPGWWAAIIGFFSSDQAKTWYKGIEDFFSPVVKTLTDAFNHVKSIFLGFFGITEGGDTSKSIMQQIKEKLGTPEGIKEVLDNVKNFFATWWTGIKVKLDKLVVFFKPLTDFIAKYATIIKDFFANLFSGVGSTSGVSFWDQFKALFGSSKDIKELFDGVIALVVKVWADFKQKIIDIFTGKKKGGILGQKASAGMMTDFGFKGGEDKKGGFFAGIFAFLGQIGDWLKGNWGWIAGGVIVAVLVSVFKVIRTFSRIGELLASKGRSYKDTIGDTFLKMAAAVVLIIGAIYAITLMVKDPNFGTAILVVGGIIVVLGVLATLNAVFSKSPIGKHSAVSSINSIGTSMLAMAGSVVLIILAIKQIQEMLGSLKEDETVWSKFGPALIAVGLILGALVLLNRFGGGKDRGINGNWKSILAIAGAMWIIVQALKPIADMGDKQLIQMGKALAGLTIAIFALLAISRMKTGKSKIAGIIGLAIGIWLLVKTLEPLAEYSDRKLERMGLILAAVAGAIALIMAATSGMSVGSGFGALMALGGIAGVIFVLGDAMSKMINVDANKISSFTNGVAIMMGAAGLTTGLLAIKGASPALAGLGSLLSSIGLALAIEALGNAMSKIVNVSSGNIQAFMEGAKWLIGITGGTTGVLAIVGAIKGGGGVAALAGLGTMLGAIGLALAVEALGNGIAKVTTSGASAEQIKVFMEGAAWLIGITGTTSGILAIASATSAGIGATLSGLGTMLGDIGLALAVEALGNGMTKIVDVSPDQIKAFMEGAAWLIGITGATSGILAIASITSAGVGATLAGLGTMLSDIGLALAIEALGNAMTKITTVSPDQIKVFMEGAANLIGITGVTTGFLALLPGLNVLGALSTAVTNASLSDVVTKLGEALALVATSGVTPEQITTFTTAVTDILAFATNIKEKGLFQVLSETIFGSALSLFAGELDKFASGVTEISTAISTVKFPLLFWVQSQVVIMVCNLVVKFMNDLKATKIQDSMNADNPAATFTSYDLKTDMSNFADAVSAIAGSLRLTVGLAMPELTAAALTAVSTIVKFLGDMNKSGSDVSLLPQVTSGWLAFWGVDDTTSTLRDNLTEFSKGLGKVVGAFNGITVGAFTGQAEEAITAVTRIVNFLISLQIGDMAKLAAVGEGSPLWALVDQMPLLGVAIGAFNTSITAVNVGSFTTVMASLNSFVTSLGALTTTVTPDAIALIKKSIGELGGLLSTDLTTNITTGIQNGTEGVKTAVGTLVTDSLAVVTSADAWTRFVASGYYIMLALATGIENETATVRVTTAIGEMVTSCITTLIAAWDRFKNMGSYLASAFAVGLGSVVSLIDTAAFNLLQGLALGISKYTYLATSAATILGNKVQAAYDAAAQIHSASRLMTDSGRNLVLGLANGINNTASVAVNAAGNLASDVTDKFKKGMANAKLWAGAQIGTDFDYKGLATKAVTSTVDKLANAAQIVGDVLAGNTSSLEALAKTYTDQFAVVEDYTPVINGNMSDDALKAALGTTGGYKYKKPGTTGTGTGSINTAAIAARVDRLGTVGQGLSQINNMPEISARLDKLANAILNMKIVMDSGVVVGQIASKMDRKLGTAAVYAGRGN